MLRRQSRQGAGLCTYKMDCGGSSLTWSSSSFHFPVPGARACHLLCPSFGPWCSRTSTMSLLGLRKKGESYAAHTFRPDLVVQGLWGSSKLAAKNLGQLITGVHRCSHFTLQGRPQTLLMEGDYSVSVPISPTLVWYGTPACLERDMGLPHLLPGVE